MDDIARYARQIALPGLGTEGQRRLAGSRAVVVGCGALGGFASMMLVRAGVGRVDVVDRDTPERTNLHRQVLYVEADVDAGTPKAVAAAGRLAEMNRDVRITPVVAHVDGGNVAGIVRDADVVVDGADNFALRLAVNEACVRHGIPFVHGGILGTVGQQFTILPGRTACYECLIGEEPAPGTAPTTVTHGVLSAIVAVVAGIQVAEAIKILAGRTDDLRKTLLTIDLWANRWTEIRVARATEGAGCPVCVQRNFGRLAPDAPGT
ncbi:MAG TPA: HesA/MoeB/ThiF family protein [Myxococcota bacterium]|nr:HesA/MoeB/ThiF family protein [Myxococcota bacterium]